MPLDLRSSSRGDPTRREGFDVAAAPPGGTIDRSADRQQNEGGEDSQRVT
jgi:hypothetical protein